VFLADDFSFLPSQVFVSAFSAFGGAGSVSCSALSADFHIEPMFLGKGFLEGIHYGQRFCPLLLSLVTIQISPDLNMFSFVLGPP
jgi:hypothetical protein